MPKKVAQHDLIVHVYHQGVLIPAASTDERSQKVSVIRIDHSKLAIESQYLIGEAP